MSKVTDFVPTPGEFIIFMLVRTGYTAGKAENTGNSIKKKISYGILLWLLLFLHTKLISEQIPTLVFESNSTKIMYVVEV